MELKIQFLRPCSGNVDSNTAKRFRVLEHTTFHFLNVFCFVMFCSNNFLNLNEMESYYCFLFCSLIQKKL